MKEAGLGTPATRAETIEKLIRVDYVERLGPAAARHLQGPPGDRAFEAARPDLGRADRDLGEAAVRRSSTGRPSSDEAFMTDIRTLHRADIVEYFRELTADEVRAQRAEIGPCPNGDGDHPIENRVGLRLLRPGRARRSRAAGL